MCCLDSLQRVVAEDVFAAEAFPPFPASVKDGYTVVGRFSQAVQSITCITSQGRVTPVYR